MEPAELLSLPVEVLHHIGRFLRVEDILACSATCHYLRYAFNDNIVWKKYLPEQFTLDLQSEDDSVEPAFCVKESLTPLCENRVVFIKKTNLVSNWRNGKFSKYRTKTSYWYASGLFNITKVRGQAIYKDRYLFLGRFIDDFSSDAIEVWDINKEPVLLMELKLNEPYYEFFNIVGDYLVVVECVQVKVYEIKTSEKSLPLLYSFLITDNEVIFHEPVSHPWEHDYRCDGWGRSIVDHYLFAGHHEIESDSCVFHIWDIVNAFKVGSFLPPINGFNIVYHSHIGCNWFLRMFQQSGNDFHLFQFNIETKSFSESVFKVNQSIIHSMFYKSWLILFDSEICNSIVCSIYDFNTSQKLKERNFNINEKYDGKVSTEVVNGQFVLLCNDGIHIVDVITLETLSKVPSEELCFITHDFNIYGSIFILGANDHNEFVVWDLSKRIKVPKCIDEVRKSHLYLNASCSKLACVHHNVIVIYDFV